MIKIHIGHMKVSEDGGPDCSTLNSRIPIIRTPKQGKEYNVKSNKIPNMI